jgi:chaperonin GroES
VNGGTFASTHFRATNIQVMAVGKGRVAANGERTPMPVAVGDFVKFRDYAGSEVRITGISYIIVRAGDCLAKWK